jgi:cobalt-zinc-cadmium efflux system membrane fusion protein
MNRDIIRAVIIGIALLLSGCGSREIGASSEHGAEAHEAEPAKGPHNGRMLVDGDFAIELAIFETGVPPEYHAWPTSGGKPVPLDDVRLTVTLTRLGDKQDRFEFAPQEDYLRGSGTVVEPHSFIVNVNAEYAGKTHQWTFESFEGRTTIASNIAETAGIKTEPAGPAKLVQTVSLYGRVVPDPAYEREVSARFPGLIKAVSKNLGDRVSEGDSLAQIESNESLQTYTLRAPISGVITARKANAGEQSGGNALFTITDNSRVVVELSVFPRDRARIKAGAPVSIKVADTDETIDGVIERLTLVAAADQSVIARARVDNRKGLLVSGSFVTGEVAVASREVPLAVKTSGLQPFRDFTVVFERIGDTYEVRMLELGEQHGEWVEVLGGLEPGAQYVTENSYVIKADVEKSGASHDH